MVSTHPDTFQRLAGLVSGSLCRARFCRRSSSGARLQISYSWLVWFLSAYTVRQLPSLDSLRRRRGSRRSLCAFLPLPLRLSDRAGEGQRVPGCLPAWFSFVCTVRPLPPWIPSGGDSVYSIPQNTKSLNTSPFYGSLCSGFFSLIFAIPCPLPLRLSDRAGEGQRLRSVYCPLMRSGCCGLRPGCPAAVFQCACGFI